MSKRDVKPEPDMEPRLQKWLWSLVPFVLGQILAPFLLRWFGFLVLLFLLVGLELNLGPEPKRKRLLLHTLWMLVGLFVGVWIGLAFGGGLGLWILIGLLLGLLLRTLGNQRFRQNLLHNIRFIEFLPDDYQAAYLDKIEYAKFQEHAKYRKLSKWITSLLVGFEFAPLVFANATHKIRQVFSKE